MAENISPDILWDVTKGFNSFQVKRRTGGGSFFTHDPYNLINKQTRKHAGFIHDKAIGLSPGSKGGITLSIKKGVKSHAPSSHNHTSTIGGRKNTGSRRATGSVVNSTSKRDYRTDLHQSVVARTSALLNSQRAKKDKPASKPRGAKAKKAAASTAAA